MLSLLHHSSRSLSLCLFCSHPSSVGRMNQREVDDLASGSLVTSASEA